MKNSTEKFKKDCRLERTCGVECGTDFKGDLFSRDWEVFVIKHDMQTGNLVGKPACCALEPV